MDKIVVKGGTQLSGEVDISCAKNSVLPIIAASILSGDRCIIDCIPMLEDVFMLSDILRSISVDIEINTKTQQMLIDTSKIKERETNNEFARKMRASFLIMGPMLSRFGRFRLSLPGGCNIGTRAIDLHLKGFSALGASINVGHGYVEVIADKLIGDKIYLDFPSVGATENILMASVLAEGETVIENAAAEPEIVDLANFVNKMGANVMGAGSDTIRIIGVKSLKGITYKPINDRIEAGSFMVAAALTGSKFKINGINEEHLKPIIAKLTEMGVIIDVNGESLIVDGSGKLNPVDIKTMPYPGFPTDMQAQMMALLCHIKGTSVITETVFENRFNHVAELMRMGANIKIDGRSAVIEGIEKLTGSEVKATDLRAGAALIMCALACEGITEITDIYHVDRGYVNIEGKLRGLGANIERIKI